MFKSYDRNMDAIRLTGKWSLNCVLFLKNKQTSDGDEKGGHLRNTDPLLPHLHSIHHPVHLVYIQCNSLIYPSPTAHSQCYSSN